MVRFFALPPLVVLLGLLVFLGASLGGPGVVLAEGTRANACASAHGGCINACDVLEADDAGRAGCVARCAADRAVCEAGKGLDTLTEQTDRIKGFLDGLANGAGGDAAPTVADCDTKENGCTQECRARYFNDEGALAGCASRCMADNAVCQAQAKLKSAAPQVKKEVDRWTRFLEGFLDQKGDGGAPTGPAPGEDVMPLRKSAPSPRNDLDI